MPPWEWRKRKLVVATARTSQRLSSHRPDFPCASRPLLRSSTQPTPFFCYECSSTVAALSCRTWFDRFLPPFFKPSPTRGSHTGYLAMQSGWCPRLSPIQLAGVALSHHRPGRVTIPRAATAQIRAKNTKQPRSSTAPLISAIIDASPCGHHLLHLSRTIVARLELPC